MLDETKYTIDIDGYEVEMDDDVKGIVDALIRIRDLGQEEACEAGMTAPKLNGLFSKLFNATRAAIHAQYDPDTAEHLSKVLSRQIATDVRGVLDNCVTGAFPLDPFNRKIG